MGVWVGLLVSGLKKKSSLVAGESCKCKDWDCTCGGSHTVDEAGTCKTKADLTEWQGNGTRTLIKISLKPETYLCFAITWTIKLLV